MPEPTIAMELGGNRAIRKRDRAVADASASPSIIFDNRLLECRMNAGVNQRAAAELLGISRPTLSMWESGRSLPTARYLDMMMLHYGVTREALYPDGDIREQIWGYEEPGT